MTVRIAADGHVTAETQGFKGSACLPWIGVLEELIEATVVDSHFTAEYYEQEEQHVETHGIAVEGRGP